MESNVSVLCNVKSAPEYGQRRNEVCLSRFAVQDDSTFAHAHTGHTANRAGFAHAHTGNTANRAATEIGQ